MSLADQDHQTAVYRREIDGVRALAVVAVMGFHAGFPLFQGGYIGVDIFFVISGYLITEVISRQMHLSEFRLPAFYLRRIFRIIPALLFVLACCIPLALLAPDPTVTKTFGAMSVMAVLFSVNFYVWSIPTGYFGYGTHDLPLVHLWSLSIEEQFYLLYPLALLVIHRFARKWLIAALLVGFVGSLALSEYASTRMISANYLLLPTRGGEFIVGGLTTLASHRWTRRFTAKRLWRETAVALGLSLIAYCVVFYGSVTPFPGLSTLPVVGGTALILLFGRSTDAVGGVLGSRPFVGMGLISYSAYLWHQPLLAFAKSYAVNDVSAPAKLCLLLLTIPLAWLTWRYVEQPLRRPATPDVKKMLYAIGGAAAVIFAVGALLWSLHGVPTRFTARHNALMGWGKLEVDRSLPCFFKQTEEAPLEQGCTAGTKGPVTTAVLGDSHAVALRPVIDDVMNARGERALFLTQAGCPPTLTMPQPESWHIPCPRLNRRVFALLARHSDIGTVVLSARWTAYLERRWPDNGEGAVEFGPEMKPADQSLRLAVAHSYKDAIDTLLASGKRVVLVYPIPEPGWVVPVAIAKREWYGDKNPLTTSAAQVRGRDANTTAAFDALGDRPGLTRIFPYRRLCAERLSRCFLQKGRTPLYFDDDHLSPAGARLLLPDFKAALDKP